MRILDLYCGAGGAAMGYHLAGFEVVGVDVEKQKNYPFEFFQNDAITHLREYKDAIEEEFDAIHASPPCQAFTNARVIHGRKHPDLLTPTRELLIKTQLPWIIENVPGAPMRADLTLCGSQFDLRDGDVGELRRHRLFEFGGWAPRIVPEPCKHGKRTISVFGHGGHIYHGVESWRRVMGISWMKRNELAQAVPPAYTELIGRHLKRSIEKMQYQRSLQNVQKEIDPAFDSLPLLRWESA